MATTLEAMVAAAKAVVPAYTAEQVQAKAQAGEPCVILDMREKDAYDQGHIPQASLLLRGLLVFRINDVKARQIYQHSPALTPRQPRCSGRADIGAVGR
jgi:hypothetical protein